MFFWIRIAWVFLCAYFRKRRSLFEGGRLSLRVWPHESEVSFANQAIYAHYLELGRWDWFIKAGYLDLALKKKFFFVLGAQHMYYRRPLKRFAKFEIISRVLGWDEKWLYLHQIIEADGEVAHKAIIKFCMVSRGKILAPYSSLSELGIPDLPPTQSSPLVDEWKRFEGAMRESS